MRRLRLVFGLLAVLLLVPVALLVQRALASVALERRVSHRAVAERLFDEMERELSALLRAEEARPFAAYGFDGSADAVNRDPPGYALGYFQIAPDGSFRAAPSARSGGAGPGGPSVREIEVLVARSLRAGTETAPGAGDLEPSPGTTRDLAPAGPAPEPSAAADRDLARASAKRPQVSPYEALQSLNKGAWSRRQRQVVLASPREDVLEPEGAPGRAPAPLAAAGRVAQAEASVPHSGVSETSGLAPRPADEAAVAAEEAFRAAPTAPALELHPMVGRLIDADRLLLYRLVLVGEQGYRQGLVVDLPALFRRLDANVVQSSGLAAFVTRDFFTQSAPPPPAERPDAFRYVHRFAEPFDALAVRLSLEPLPGVAGAGYLYAIAALLLVSGTAGLLALYRMVAVTVRFAERRNNFVAAVSHELKTPLTAIRMYGEMLRDGMVTSERKRGEYYGTIAAESERLSRLIDNVLEFSRLEQGTRETSLVVGSVEPVVREAAELLAPHAREVGFRVEVEADPDLPAVRFDRDALLQVVFNLVDNALKYARGAGDRVVRVHCGADGEGVTLAVRDRGPGVAGRHLEHIFDPFYRGEDELTRTAKGTGIGLALVRGLADAMGAVVSGRNLAEGGFEVALRFPAASSG